MPFQPHVHDELQRGVQGNSGAAQPHVPVVTTGANQRWSDWERTRFFQGLERYPNGPWQQIAEFIGSKTRRQVMCHAQKLRQRLARQQRRQEALLALQSARLEAAAGATPSDAAAASAERRVAAAIEMELLADELRAPDDEQEEAAELERPMSPTTLALLDAQDIDEFMAATDHVFAGAPAADELEPLPASWRL